MKLFRATLCCLPLWALGCGDGDGLRATGSVQLVVRQTGAANGQANFTLPAGTYVDAPPGVGVGFFGTCTLRGSQYTLDLSRAAGGNDGLRQIKFTAGAAGGSVSAEFALGSSVYRGQGQCTGTAVAVDNDAVRFEGSCTNLTSDGDPRVVDATINVTLTGCK